MGTVARSVRVSIFYILKSEASVCATISSSINLLYPATDCAAATDMYIIIVKNFTV